MIRKLLTLLVFLVFVGVVGGFIVLSAWNVPIQKKQIVQSVDASQFLQTKS